MQHLKNWCKKIKQQEPSGYYFASGYLLASAYHKDWRSCWATGAVVGIYLLIIFLDKKPT